LKECIIGLVFCALLSACTKPISQFRTVSTDLTAPTVIDFENLSTGAESYTWKVDSKIVSDSTDFNHLFLSSGRHTIELVSTHGSKKSISRQDIFIEAPSECLVYMLTNLGPLLFSLSDKTPIHRDNFLDLVTSSYYDGIKFHRVINGFMVQAGDPETNTASKKIPHKKEIEQEINTGLLHYKGALAAARMPDNINPKKASSSTQFYIVEGQTLTAESVEQHGYSKLFDYSEDQKLRYIKEGGTPQLDGEYTVFGHLIDGYDTLEAISNTATDGRDNPIESVIIIKATSIN
jgi:cyclophilin family peptidyl-prolyl cis-trans isomerase